MSCRAQFAGDGGGAVLLARSELDAQLARDRAADAGGGCVDTPRKDRGWIRWRIPRPCAFRKGYVARRRPRGRACRLRDFPRRKAFSAECREMPRPLRRAPWTKPHREMPMVPPPSMSFGRVPQEFRLAARVAEGPLGPSYCPSLPYSASVTGSSHSFEVSVPGHSTARWLNQLPALAPCQCFTPAGMVTTSPGLRLCADLPAS